MSGGRGLVAPALASVLLGCSPTGAPDERSPSPAVASPSCHDDGSDPVVLDGCAAVADDDRCIVAAPAELRLWRPSWAAGCTITLDGEPLGGREHAIDGGWLSELPIAAGAQQLALRRTLDAAPTWQVRLAEEPAAPAGSSLARMREAIVRRRQSFVREDWTATLAAAEEAFTLAHSLERWSEACASAFAAAHVLAEGRGALDEASAWLRRTDACLSHDRAQTTRLHNLRGRIAALAGDERTAQSEYRAAARSARRIGRVDDELAAGAAHAELARAIGDGVAVAQIVERITTLTATGIDSCTGAIAASDIAWAQLMLAEHRTSSVDARPALQRALITLAEPRCARPSVLAHTRLNLALAELQAGAPERAAQVLDSIGDDGLDAGARHWFHDLRIRVALARGRPDAARSDLEALERAAMLHRDGELRWRAALRRGELELARGRVEDGRRALRTAEQELDRLALELALDLGRPQYLAQHGRSAELLTASLVDGDALDEALCVARHAHARAIRSLELAARVDLDDPALARARVQVRAARDELDRAEQGARRLPSAELSVARERLADARARLRARMITGGDEDPVALDCAVPSPVLTLLYTPHGSGWIGFARDADGTTAAVIPAFDRDIPRAASDALLAPFAARIDASERVHVIAQGELLAVPMHALPWHEGVLVDHTVVAWSVDLAVLPEPRLRATALVAFSDAQDDLGHLRPQVEQAAARVSAAGWRLHGDGAHADRGPRLRQALAEVDLFHYFGHVGVPSFEHRAEHPWSTMLLLREGTLGIDDVLALAAVPRHVVLLGCGTALAGPLRPGSGEGLAQAFLAAGAQQVIAAVGDLDAQLAASVGTELYADEARALDLAAALARVQRRVRHRDDARNWWALRAWVR